MIAPLLSKEQKNALRSRIRAYKEWLTTSNGVESIKEHRDHERFFKMKLHSDRIDSMTEREFREVYTTLWASGFWGNKDWYIDNKLLGPNELEKIRDELKKLLYGCEEFAARYDRFRENIKGFGPSSISEILHFVFPEKYNAG